MKIKLILILPVLMLLGGCGSSSSNVDPIVRSENRKTMVKSTAVAYATKYALYWESAYVNNHLEAVSRNLDNTFNFRQLLLKNEVIPPILRESTGNVTMTNATNIRVSDRIIEIIQPARFSSAIPNWRNYLNMQFKKPDLPNNKMLPENNEERVAWDEGLIEGWTVGRWQARSIFAANIGIMQRDIAGMILYHKLLSQGMISPTYSSTANYGITGNSQSMRLNDRIVKITKASELTPNSSTSWKPALLPAQ